MSISKEIGNELHCVYSDKTNLTAEHVFFRFHEPQDLPATDQVFS